MRTRVHLTTVLSLALVTATAVGACGGEGDSAAVSPPPTGRGGGGGQAGKGGGGQAGQAAGGQGGAGSGQAGSGVQVPSVVALALDPPGASLLVASGQPLPSSAFAVTATLTDGTTAKPPGTPTWSFTPADLASVTAAGLVTASGQRGGVGKLTASVGGLTAEASVTVTLALGVDQGLTPADKAALGQASEAKDLRLLYPYDGTVFPLGLAPPQLMWLGAAAGDRVLVELSSPQATLQAFVVDPDGAGRYTPEAAAWAQLSETARGDKVAVKVARLGSDGLAQAVTQSWTLASGGLHGSVYYWANNKGRILRIRPGAPAPAPEDFLAEKLPGCTTCHSVSARGNVMALQRRTPYPAPAGTTDNQLACGETAVAFDLTTNTTRSEEKAASACDEATGAVSAWSRYFTYAALNAQGDVLVQMSVPGAWDTITNQPINTGLTKSLAYPAFSADDRLLSFVEGTGDVRVVDWDNAARTFGVDRLLVPANPDPAAANLAWASYTSLSPDHRLVTYGRGNYGASYITPSTEAAPTPNPTAAIVAATTNLFVAPTDQTGGQEIELRRLNGDDYPFPDAVRDRLKNYEPTFAPVAVGGYLWVVFTSRRTYGNLLTSPEPMAVKQLWIAAIDLDPKPGHDPSHPAFWLPGQDLGDLNMRGFWALDPCKADGGACGSGTECCGGLCRPSDPSDPQSPRVCLSGDAPGSTCSNTDEKCATTADCCGAATGTTCVAGFCAQPPPDID